MKKLFRISMLILAVLILKVGDTTAQKFGYVNSQLLLSQMPDVKQMESNLTALGKQLQSKGEQMVTSYKQKEEKAIRDKEAGTMSPVEEETLLAELQKTQEEILTFEKEMQNKLLEKRNELLAPIYEKINSAIAAIAKEDGYKMIFDSQVLLYAEESEDLSNKVKAKLGI